MESREIYQESYNYLESIKRNLAAENINIDLTKVDTKTKGEIIDLLNRYCIKRKGEIWNNVLNGSHDTYLG